MSSISPQSSTDHSDLRKALTDFCTELNDFYMPWLEDGLLDKATTLMTALTKLAPLTKSIFLSKTWRQDKSDRSAEDLKPLVERITIINKAQIDTDKVDLLETTLDKVKHPFNSAVLDLQIISRLSKTIDNSYNDDNEFSVDIFYNILVSKL